MAYESLLVLSGQGLPPFSTAGLLQTIAPIAQASVQRRTVNGELINLSPTQFRKYRSTITAGGIGSQPPAFDAIEVGDILTVDCAEERGYLTSGGAPSRPVVPGSSRVEGSYTFYRMRLTMMVVDMPVETNEDEAEVSWSLELEEV